MGVLKKMCRIKRAEPGNKKKLTPGVEVAIASKFEILLPTAARVLLECGTYAVVVVSCVFFVNFSDEQRELTPINLAVSLSSPMIELWVLMNPQKELPAVIPAEGPIFCVGLGHQVACAVARTIYASLAAAPLFAASGRGIRIGRQGFIP